MEGVKNAVKHPALPLNLVRAKFDSLGQQWDQLGHLADETNKTGVTKYQMVVGGVAADLVGIRQLVGAYDGADPYTLEKFSTAERILNGVLGGVQLVTTAVGISAFLGRMVNACRGGLLGASCFVIDTEVVRRLVERPMLATVSEGARDSALDADGGDSWSSVWLVAAAGVLAVAVSAWEVDRRRWMKWQQQIADCFASGELLEELFLSEYPAAEAT